MEKIFDYKGSDFIKGQSAHVNLPIGGLFRSIENFNPFEQAGIVLPSLNPIDQPLATTPNFLTSFNNIGADYIYAHTPTKLYQVLKDSPYTVTDQTAQAYQGASGTPSKIMGRIKWKNGYVYSFGTSNGNSYVNYNAFPVAAASDINLLANFLLSSATDSTPFCVGADLNLYMGNANRLQEFVNVTGTSGNSTHFFIDDGFIIRDIQNDGRYLVILADNNAISVSGRRVGNYQCKVYFWDMVQTDANSRIVPEAVWDIEDSWGIALAPVDGAIQIFTYSGISICNVVTQPKMIRQFSDNANSDLLPRPLRPSQVVVHNGSTFWVDGYNNQNTDIYAYGNPISGQQKIFYRPYMTGAVHLATCLLWVGGVLILGTDEPGLNFFNVGTVRGTATIGGLIEQKPTPYTYGFTKVALATKLAVGQSVTLTIFSNATNSTISSETKSYDSSNPKQTLLFKRVPSTGSPDKLSDVSFLLRSVGALVARITGYGTPLVDTNEEL